MRRVTSSDNAFFGGNRRDLRSKKALSWGGAQLGDQIYDLTFIRRCHRESKSLEPKVLHQALTLDSFADEWSPTCASQCNNMTS